MRLLAFPVFLSLIGIASAASSVPDCGERGSRWLADFHHQGWRGPAGCLADHRSPQSRGERRDRFMIIARDRNTGENIFGTPPHGPEGYYPTPWRCGCAALVSEHARPREHHFAGNRPIRRCAHQQRTRSLLESRRHRGRIQI